MYFWNIEALKRDISNNKLTSKKVFSLRFCLLSSFCYMHIVFLLFSI